MFDDGFVTNRCKLCGSNRDGKNYYYRIGTITGTKSWGGIAILVGLLRLTI
jgi:hypothetical protein